MHNGESGIQEEGRAGEPATASPAPEPANSPALPLADAAFAPPSALALFEDLPPEISTNDVPQAVTHLLNRSQRRIADAVYDMATSEEQQVEFIHSTFASVGLPRSQFAGRIYERTCGRASLRVEAGSIWDGERWLDQPVPYGTKPRTLLVYLTSYAVRHRSKVIPVGDTFTEFLRMLGEENLTGGVRGSRPAYKKQIAALAAATVRLGVPTRNGVDTSVAQPIKKFSLWYAKNEDGQRPLWPGEITLSSEYYESVLERAFPIDARALHALSASAMAMDMYLWLASRLWRVGSRPAFVPWSALFMQFGKDGTFVEDKERYLNLLRDFKKIFKTYLTRVLLVYPDAKVELTVGGVVLKQSAPPVARTIKAALRREDDED